MSPSPACWRIKTEPRDGDKPPRYTTVSIRSSGIDWYECYQGYIWAQSRTGSMGYMTRQMRFCGLGQDKHASLHVVPQLRTIIRHKESVTVASSDSTDAEQSLVLFRSQQRFIWMRLNISRPQCLFQSPVQTSLPL